MPLLGAHGDHPGLSAERISAAAGEFLDKSGSWWNGTAVIGVDEQETYDALIGLGHNAVLTSAGKREDGGLPPGSMALLDAVGEIRGPVVLVDLFSQGADTLHVLKALSLLQEHSDDVVVPIREVRDHPCQLSRYFVHRGAGFMHILDRDYRDPHGLVDAGGVAGRACKLPLEGTPGRGTVWDARSIVGPQLVELSLEEFRESSDRIACVTDGNGMSRLIFHEASFAKSAGGHRVLGTTAFSIHSPRLHLAESGQGIRFVSDEPVGDDSRVIGIMNDEGLETVIPMQRLTDVPMGRFCAGEGFPFLILSEISQGGYDIAMRFQSESSLWVIRNGIVYNGSSGKHITGRWDFPDCKEVQAIFAAGEAHNLPRYHDLLRMGRVRGMDLDAESPAGKTSAATVTKRMWAAG